MRSSIQRVVFSSFTLGCLAFLFGLTGGPSLPTGSYLQLLTSTVHSSVGQAAGRRGEARRVARRTARRTSRRVARRHSIAGCRPYNAYYYCSGVYYRPIVENGVTVYVVVNP
jgi:hypothetical protein